MKAVMSCDAVFEVLTRGPYPADADPNREVDLHLQACHSCRQLAEALRPAVGLLHEAMSAEEESELPAYLGRVQDAIYSAEESPEHEQAVRVRTSRAEKCAALFLGGLVGLAASLVIWHTGTRDRGWETTQDSIAMSKRGVVVAQHRWERDEQPRLHTEWLAALRLSPACYPVSAGKAAGQSGGQAAPSNLEAASRAGANLVCCTRCHYAGESSLVSREVVQRIASACAACHQRPTVDQTALLGLLWRGMPSRAC